MYASLDVLLTHTVNGDFVNAMQEAQENMEDVLITAPSSNCPPVLPVFTLLKPAPRAVLA